jgi:hypothetical protein
VRSKDPNIALLCKSSPKSWRERVWVRFIMQTRGVAETSKGLFLCWGLDKVFAAKDKISWKKGESGTLNSGLTEAETWIKWGFSCIPVEALKQNVFLLSQSAFFGSLDFLCGTSGNILKYPWCNIPNKSARTLKF